MVPDRYGTPDDEVPPNRDDPLSVAYCHLCDDDGMRGLYQCDHIDYGAIAKRHMPRITAMLKKPKEDQ